MLLQCQRQTEPKDQIVALLGEQFPLTAHKIYNLMKKRYLTGTTYHAVYKHLRHLAEEGVLVKNGTEYMLNGEWLEGMRQFTNATESRYSNMLNGVNITEIDDAKVIVFRNFEQYFMFVEDFRNRYLDGVKGNGEVYWIGTHAWGPLFFMKDRVKSIRKSVEKNVNYYVAIRGGTKLDYAMGRFYSQTGIRHVRVRLDDDNGDIIGIYGDTMLYFIIPEKIKAIISGVFEETGSLSDLNIGPAFDKILRTESNFFLIMTKNRKLIEEQKNAILKFFDHEKPVA